MRWRVLLAIALVEFCAAAGDPLSRELAGAAVPPSALGFHTWVAFIGAIPAGWLGDRFLTARRAILLGTILALAGLAAVAIPWPAAAYVGLALRAIGIAFLRGNTFVLLGRALDGPDENRRLEFFLWVGFASSVGGTLASELRRGFPGTGAALAAAVGVAALSLWAVQQLRRNLTHSEFREPVRHRRLVATALAVAVPSLAAIAFLVERFTWWTVIAAWLLPVSALCAFVVALVWWRIAAHRLRPADNRRIGTFFQLAAYAILIGAVSALAGGTTSDPSDTWQRSFVGLLFLSLPIALRWRARTYPPPSAAGVFSVAFFLQSVACLGFAALAMVTNLDAMRAVQFVIDALVVGSAGVAAVLVMAAGRSAATTLAPTLLAGTMLGLWRTSATIGSGLVDVLMPAGALDRDTHGIALLAAAAACVLLGLVLQTRRHLLARDELADPPPAVEPLRLRNAAMTLSGAVAALGLVWIVVGRGAGGDAVIAASRTVTFGDAARAYLPDDALYGFVRFPPGSFPFNKAPVGSGSMWSEYSIALDELYVAKYEVTVAQYELCVNEGGCRPADSRAIAGPAESPVRFVTWFEARDYCLWLERKLAAISPPPVAGLGTAMRVALPSEPEWERAAGDHGATGYPWRGPLAPARANYAASGRLAPVPVGDFTAGATADGIYDLSGNVAEWTRSEYRDYPYAAADGREDPNSGAATRVIRGGSYYDGPSLLKVTARQAADPSRGYEFVGFRVVITRLLAELQNAPTQVGSPPPATTQ